MIERAAAARRAALDFLFVGDQHVSPTPYYQNSPMLGRLLAEWGEAPAPAWCLPLRRQPGVLLDAIGGGGAEPGSGRGNRRRLGLGVNSCTALYEEDISQEVRSG